ncbi:MAG TPA: tRNA lysidine(34) synthetase TilS [Longimicrobiales bacterium]
MTAELRARVIDFVRRRRLIERGDHVLVALSGGVDSMVLLHLLHNAADALGIDLTAAHFDHAMRPASADDAQWVAGVCRAWGVPLISERTSAALYGEAAARTARYDFLETAAQRTGATRIATAHHADDQIETVLFRLLRGTGLRGLAGIPVRRGIIIRPLLRFHKYELQAYAAQQQLSFREDETNLSEGYARNRIRRALIPIMQTVNPDAPAAILALARHAARSERAWKSIMTQLRPSLEIRRQRDSTELARGKLLEYDADIRARVLRAELRRFGCAPERASTRNMLRFIAGARSGAALDVAADVRLERAYDVIRIARRLDKTAAQPLRIESCDDGSATVRIGDGSWRVQWTRSPTSKPGSARFSCDSLTFPLELRSWRPGDRMRLPYGTKKLKKLFAEARVPVNERASVPVLLDADGRVCWLVGFARSVDAVPVADDPALTITVSHAEIR